MFGRKNRKMMIGDRECIDVSLRSMKELDDMRMFARSPTRYAVVDVETTGLSPKNDEILQVAICDGNGTPLLNTYVCPTRRKRWPKAQDIHGITWQMVKDAPTLGEIASDIMRVFQNKALIIGYNLRFDFMMFVAGGVDTQTYGYSWDIMNDCSVMFGTYSQAHGSYTYIRLTTAARKYGYSYKAHDALEDAKATAHVFRKLMGDDEYENKVREKESFLGVHALVPLYLVGTSGADEWIREYEKSSLKAQSVDKEKGQRNEVAEEGHMPGHFLTKIPTWVKATLIVLLCLFGLVCCWNGCVACSVAHNERLERENDMWLKEQWRKKPTVNPDYHGPLEPKPYHGG